MVFPAGAVAYSGSVRVFANYLNPTDIKLPLFMPGDLRGISAGGAEQSLSTYGMLAVELRGQADEELQLAVGKEAEITVPIPGTQAADAPASIPLWHYDLDQARWLEEGSAQKSGNQYVGKVKHFSWWNYDASAPSIILSGKVYLDDLQHPMSGVAVWAEPIGNGLGIGCGHGTTDENGCFMGAVTKGLTLKIHIFAYNSSCSNTEIYRAVVGPFEQDATLPPIIVTAGPTAHTVNIDGRLLDCNGQPTPDGYALVSAGLAYYICPTDANGNFKAAFIHCGSSVNGTVVGYDAANLLESPVQSFPVPPFSTSVGDLSVCQTISEFIQYDVDGESFTVIHPTGFLEIGRTFISGQDSLQNKGTINFAFQNNGQTGTFPLQFLSVQKHWQGSIKNVLVNTTVTEYGAPNKHISGTFGGTYQTSNGVPHNIMGSYRVKRNF